MLLEDDRAAGHSAAFQAANVVVVFLVVEERRFTLEARLAHVAVVPPGLRGRRPGRRRALRVHGQALDRRRAPAAADGTDDPSAPFIV